MQQLAGTDPIMEDRSMLEAEWERYESVSSRLVRYLKTSEEEFGRLIQALDECWTLTESVQGATARLLELTGVTSGSGFESIRLLMVTGWDVSRVFLKQIRGGSEQLSSVMQNTRELLAVSDRMEEHLKPLKYIAMYLRLEGSRLTDDDSVGVQEFHKQMLDVLGAMKRSGESQRGTLDTILEKLLAATQLVERASESYTLRANESEQRTQSDLALLMTVPPDLLALQQLAEAFEKSVAVRIKDAVKNLQGHDTIRQRLEHILKTMAGLPMGPENRAGRALLIQRQQTRSVLEQIKSTGSRIELELNGIVAAAQGIAAVNAGETSKVDPAKEFETAVDRVSSLSTEIAGLLAGEVEVGTFVITQIVPIRDLLGAKSRELETMAGTMKILAMNVVIVAKSIPAAKSIDVLGSWTSEAAESVLVMARELNLQFDRLGGTLQILAVAIREDMTRLESCQSAMSAYQFDASLRGSRRKGYEEARQLSLEAHQLQEKTEALLSSVKFVSEGSALLGELDDVMAALLLLYPISEGGDELDSASAGYTMRSQHEAHGLESWEHVSEEFARLSEVPEGQNYGDNVELF
jgi:hypothetical protein